jgi:hypothetical protein
MAAVTRQDAKELFIKTLEVRGCCTDKELLSLPEFHIGAHTHDLERILDELVDAYEIIAVEFQSETSLDIRTVYFPLGICVYEPGLRVKNKVLPNHVAQGLETLKKEGFVNDDMLEGVPRRKLIEFYDAILKYIVDNKEKKLTAKRAHKILKKVRHD